ncbi:MAG TPA: DUF5808 domain-containing protein [Caulobacteraceae bacterium]|nr:DUF5808 domain-containing protein [Caulobacteraceae bacterium]
MTEETEWADPQNWSGRFFAIYFSKRDPRLWVPKRRPGWGWTLNMGHPQAGAWLLGVIVLIPLAVAAAAALD